MEWQLKDRKVEIADLETVRRYVEDLRDLLKEGAFVERKSFVKSFVKEVKVTGNEVVLTYTIPVAKDGITNEKHSVSVYCTVWWAILDSSRTPV